MNKCYFLFLLIALLSCKDKLNTSANNDDSSLLNSISIFGGQKVKIDSTLIANQNDSLLTVFYKKYNNETVWSKDDFRNFVINEIKNCENDGLNPDDYSFSKLNLSKEQYNDLSEKQLGEYDILFTKNAKLYISNVNIGKLNPYKLYSDWDLGTKSIDENKILFECIDNNNFSKIFEQIKPQNFVYKQLQDALKTLKSYPTKFIEQTDISLKITPNSSNSSIKNIKRKLIYWKDLRAKDSALTNLYDKPTQEAVKKFQKRHGLFPDAVIGKSTIEALNFSKNQRLEQVVVNMERLKWCANDLGNHYILVNIPDYKLVVYKNGDSVRSHKVVVGKDSRRTPILSSKISNIVLNPTWTVPPTILKEDVFPAAQRNKNAFRRKGLRIFNSRGKEISPSSWTMATSNRYRYVQNPSRNNSLGSMKIDFPNNFSVYLHDTNHRDLFVRNYRALSSGCVRVNEPLKLAEYIINDTVKWNAEKIETKTHVRPQKTEFIKIKEDIYVHQFYWTSWQENGELQFREDIYCYDFDLYSKLRY